MSVIWGEKNFLFFYFFWSYISILGNKISYTISKKKKKKKTYWSFDFYIYWNYLSLGFSCYSCSSVCVRFLSLLLPGCRMDSKSNTPSMAYICWNGDLLLCNGKCWNRVVWALSDSHFLFWKIHSELHWAVDPSLCNQCCPRGHPSWTLLMKNIEILMTLMQDYISHTYIKYCQIYVTIHY